MAKLAIKIPIRTRDKEGKDADYIKSKLSRLKLDWVFYGESSTFISDVKIIKKKGNFYKHELLGIKKLLDILPNNTNLLEDYNKYIKLDEKDYIYDVEVVFLGEIAVEVDVESNSILFYDGPKSQELKRLDMSVLKKFIKDDNLEDFYEEKVKKLVLAIVMSIAIAYPEININSATTIVAFDGNVYKKEQYFSYYPIHNDSIKEYGNIIDSSVSFDDCFNWIKKHTSLADKEVKTPVIFSSLSYVFNRELHEILIYSIIGLESIYAPSNKGIAYTLQKNINTVFPMVRKDMIKNLYKMRSEFIHGEISVGNFQLIDETIDSTHDYSEPCKLAIALLIATVRKLIENDATGIKFKETISFEYEII